MIAVVGVFYGNSSEVLLFTFVVFYYITNKQLP